jgi:hypothetical protein
MRTVRMHTFRSSEFARTTVLCCAVMSMSHVVGVLNRFISAYANVVLTNKRWHRLIEHGAPCRPICKMFDKPKGTNFDGSC